ncbi:MAG: hypothetical protein FWD30_01285 [Dehalococcoidia bacterium]|nr:hypothetical protein [Dehalococcoidia bacterium]
MVKQIKRTSSGMDIPDWVFEALARCLLPKIQRYYESEESKKDLAEYRAEKATKALHKKRAQTTEGFGDLPKPSSLF